MRKREERNSTLKRGGLGTGTQEIRWEGARQSEGPNSVASHGYPTTRISQKERIKKEKKDRGGKKKVKDEPGCLRGGET